MVLVLAGMVGWLYWQQTRIVQNMGHIIAAIGELAQRPAVVSFPPPAVKEEEEVTEVEEIDDRASVEHETPAVVAGPPAVDTDDLESKSKKDLQDILAKRGIPYSKSDTKTALISLLKATA